MNGQSFERMLPKKQAVSGNVRSRRKFKINAPMKPDIIESELASRNNGINPLFGLKCGM